VAECATAENSSVQSIVMQTVVAEAEIIHGSVILHQIDTHF